VVISAPARFRITEYEERQWERAMPGDERPFEERLQAIERRLEAIERRLGEGMLASAQPEYNETSTPTGALIEEASIVSIVGLIGRTLIVLGGAFLIRFMTESSILPQFAGTAVGIAYALFWVVLANGAARKDAYESATFHGISAAMIGFPLLWETTLKFEYLTPMQSAAAVTVFTAIPLVVAWYREMRGFAMVIGAPGALTMLGLGFATKTLPPFFGALLLLGLATLILAYDRKWYLLGAFVACVADFGVCVATVLRLSGEGTLASLSLAALCLAQMALGAVYFGTFSFLVFRRNRNLAVIEVAQVVVVLLIGLGGFVGASVGAPEARTALGLSVFVLAAAGYGGAYHLLRHDTERSRTFVVYSAAAAAAALVAAYLTFRGASLPILLALGALACSMIGSRRKSLSLGVHGAIYILAAAYSSGLVWGTVVILWGANLVPEFWTHPAPWIVFVVSLAVMLLQPGTSDLLFERYFRRARLPAMLLTVMTLAALVVSVAFGFSAEIDERGMTESAILRTAVISVAAVLLALLSKKKRFAQSKWLVMPLLLAGGVKLLAQDLPSGKPSVLFGSLAIFGAALIIAPRLLRMRASEDRVAGSQEGQMPHAGLDVAGVAEENRSAGVQN
jgi:hypothetical protein